MKFGFNINLSLGRKRKQTKGIGGQRLAPFFTENKESGMPYIVSGTDIKDIVQALRGGHSDRSLLELFGTVAEVYAPIHEVMSRVVNGKFGFRKRSTKEVVENNKDLNKLITQVNPFQNFKQLVYELGVYEICTGKNFQYLNIPGTLARDYKNIATQMNLPAERVTIKTPERLKIFSATKIEDVIDAYILDKGERDETIFATDRVIYRRKVNVDWKGKKIEGRSPLLSAEMALINLVAVYKARGTVYIKRGRMGMWVSSKTDASGTVALTDAEKKRARKDLDANFGLDGKKDTTGLSDVPMDFVKSSMSIAEMEPFKETKADAAAIYAVVGVPEEFIPDAEGTTFDNKAKAEKGLYQNTVIPYADNICETLTSGWGIDLWDYEVFVDFSHVECLQDNKKDEAERKAKIVEYATKQYKDGAITYNEWLIAMGYTARGAEFDKYITELTSVPMAVKIGVGGTQAMQSVVADPNLSEEAKANLLVLLFGISIEEARSVVVSTPKKPDEEKSKEE